MSYEEEFDSIMRNKAEELEYPFEQAHWEKVNSVLEQRRTGGSEVLRSLMWSAAVVVAGGVATLLWFGPANNDSKIAAVQNPGAEATVTVTDQAHNTSVTPQPEVNIAFSGANRPAEKIVEAGAMSAGSGNAVSAVQGRSENEGRARLRAVPVITPGNTAANDEKRSETFISSDEMAAQQTPDTAEAGLYVDFLSPMQISLTGDPVAGDVRLSGLHAVRADDDYVARKKDRCLFFGVEGGAAFWTGWQSQGAHNGRGINWFAGATVGKKLDSRWQITTGFQVFNFAHLDAPFYSAESKTYGFGSVTATTVITTESLRYFGIPVRVGYTFAGGGQLRAGIIGAQLWHATNTVETSSLRNSETMESASKRNNMLYDGMNQQLLMLTAGYGVRLSDRVFAGVDIVYGLTDLFSERTYLQRVEQPLMIRVGLQYSFTKK